MIFRFSKNYEDRLKLL